MVSKIKAIEALDKVSTVYFEESDAVDANNGILNTDYLLYQKRRLLKKHITYLAEDLVRHRQGFPHNNISDVKFKGDFVVLSGEDFNSIRDLIESIDE